MTRYFTSTLLAFLFSFTLLGGTAFAAPGGIATKFRILEIEGAQRPGEPGLFESLPLKVKPR